LEAGDRLAADLEENLQRLGPLVGLGVSFDVLVRKIQVGGRQAAFLFIDGFIKDLVTSRLLQVLQETGPGDLAPRTMQSILDRHLPYVEVSTRDTLSGVIDCLLTGQAVLLIDQERQAVVVDVREYPTRNPEEPDLERVIRGSRDGFVETLIFNTVLVRRRLRDPALRIELVEVGARSRTDVAVLYLEDVAPPELVKTVKERIGGIKVDGLPMAEKALEEFIVDRQNWWNPFPTVRYTERPDVAAIHLLEGHVLILVDTSPSAIILPVSLFHHLQHAQEFREAPVVGVYVRLIRLLGVAVSWVGPPLWVALVLAPGKLPPFLAAIGPKDPGTIHLGVQFILAEFGVNLVRIALIHTPTALATSLGFIGAIVLGEIAVAVGLFCREALLYVGLAALGSFATPSVEFASAVGLVRMFLLALASVLHLAGLGVGLIAVLVLLARTRSFGLPYLWPLYPLDVGALWNVLIRQPVPTMVRRPRFLRLQQRKRARR